MNLLHPPSATGPTTTGPRAPQPDRQRKVGFVAGGNRRRQEAGRAARRQSASARGAAHEAPHPDRASAAARQCASLPRSTQAGACRPTPVIVTARPRPAGAGLGGAAIEHVRADTRPREADVLYSSSAKPVSHGQRHHADAAHLKRCAVMKEADYAFFGSPRRRTLVEGGPPLAIRRILRQVPIVVRGAIIPPDGASLSEFMLGTIDRGMGRSFGSIIARSPGRAHGAAGIHQSIDPSLPHLGRQMRVRSAP